MLVGIAVLGGVAVVAAGRGQGLPPAEPDRPDVAVPEDRPLVREDVDRLRFSVGLRGYRMDEVDDVLDRVAGDLAERDAHIGDLEARLAAVQQAPKHAAPSQEAPATDVRAETTAPAVEGVGDEGALAEAEPEHPTARTMIVPVHELDDAEHGATPGEPGRG